MAESVASLEKPVHITELIPTKKRIWSCQQVLPKCNLVVQVRKGSTILPFCEECQGPYCTIVNIKWNEKLGTVDLRLQRCEHSDGLMFMLAKI